MNGGILSEAGAARKQADDKGVEFHVIAIIG